MTKRKKYWMGYCLLSIGLTACLKETVLPVKTSFEHKIEGAYQTTPLKVDITNTTTGADFYEWTFEGGEPALSKEKNPGQVTFTEPGEHRIILRAWNDMQEDTKTITVRVDSAVSVAFDCPILVNDFAPADVRIENKTKGATHFEWTFEGGTPASSTLPNPGIIRFDTEGIHKISLIATNGSETFTSEKNVYVSAPMTTDFSMAPIATDLDMEAPLTAIVKNLSKSFLSLQWRCEGGLIANDTAEETTIHFDRAGIYTVTLHTDNEKEQQTVSKQITVKENKGIHIVKDLHFGINQAKNTIGCFFSAEMQRVLKAKEIIGTDIGKSIDIGFFALNSDFDHCYFFSPDKAKESAFSPIPGAIRTEVRNIAGSGNGLTEEVFDRILKAADMDAFDFTEGKKGEYFVLNKFPVFVLFKTEDQRRGIIQIKEVVKKGADSYAIADVKIEKRKSE